MASISHPPSLLIPFPSCAAHAQAENRALKEELSRVREQLAALQPCAALPPMPMPAYGSYMVAL
jgi:hypothetical protein